MTRLWGFRCDNCGTESIQRPHTHWIEVRTLLVNESGFTAVGTSDGLHYCGVACLTDAIENSWEQR